MKNKVKTYVAAFSFSIIALVSSQFLDGRSDTELEKQIEATFTQEVFKDYDIIEVDGGDLSGHREPKVAVDIGFGDREYWGFTNEHAQLVMVIAKEIILQDDYTEPVLETGRYYEDEADVKGTELREYDQGHVIADSLGGVANAYNICPQDSYVNRKGEQAEFENRIRNNRGCTDFICIITYPDTETQIPSKYQVIYRINGKVFTTEFKNGEKRRKHK